MNENAAAYCSWVERLFLACYLPVTPLFLYLLNTCCGYLLSPISIHHSLLCCEPASARR
jgi:hypothetical protein